MPNRKPDATPIDDFEAVIPSVVDHTMENRKKLLQHFGKRPWGDEKLTPEERLQRYNQVADDPIAWQELNRTAVSYIGLSQGLWSRELLEDAAKLYMKSQGAGEDDDD